MRKKSIVVKMFLANRSDESALLVQWNPVISIPLTLTVSIFCFLSLSSRLAMINYIKKVAPDRPINLNILIDQAVELPTITIQYFMVLTSLMTGKPIEELYGHNGSVLFWITGLIHSFNMAIGSCGIAIYRVICIRDWSINLDLPRFATVDNHQFQNNNVLIRFRAKSLMQLIMRLEIGLEYIAVTYLLIIHLIFLEDVKTLPPFAYCQGITIQMAKIINFKQSEEKKVLLLILPFLLKNACQIIELICYIIIYTTRHKNDENMRESITDRIYFKRRRGNVLTLSTQVAGFALEMVVNVLVMAALKSQTTDFSLVKICSLFTDVSVSTLQVLSSGDIREYYSFK